MAYALVANNGTAAYDTTNYKFGAQAKAPGWVAGTYGVASSDPLSAFVTSGSSWSNGTVEGWVRRASAPSSIEVFASDAGVFWLGVASGGTAMLHVGNGVTAFGANTDQNVSLVSTQLCDGNWHHWALVFAAAGGATLYVDGVSIGSTAANPVVYLNASGPGLNLGGLWTGGGSPYPFNFGGNLDEVAVSSVKQYTSNFTPAATALSNTRTGQVALYHFGNPAPLADSNGAATASSYTLAAPSPASGVVNAASGSFVVTISGTTSAATVFTPTDGGAGGTFNPATLSLASGTNVAGGFTYTPSSTGVRTISTTNGGGLTDPTGVSYTSSAAGASAATIPPNDANIIYAPGVWDVTSTRAKAINAGACFRVAIAGSATAITLNFDVSADLTPLPQIMTRVDRGAWAVQEVAAAVALAMPSGASAGNAWTSHLVEFIVKSSTETQLRWATQGTGVSFTGIATSPNTAGTSPGQQAPLKGMVFGDSITEGVRVLMQTAPSGKDTDRNDASIGWACELGRLIGAEIGVVGFGGTGWTVAGSGSVPAFPSSYGMLWGSGPSRSLAGLDFIVVNHGTNDAAASASSVTAAVTALLNGMLAATTTTQIFVMRPFNGTQASAIAAGIAGCSNPARVTYVDTTGWLNAADTSDGMHPFGYANVMSLAPRLAAALRTKLRGVANRWSHA